MLSLQNLTAVLSSSFRLDDVGFEVRPDERIAVLGPNGSGKSYLLRLILGLETPDGGRIAWNDEVLSSAGSVNVPPQSRGMGVVFQEGALFPHLDVRRNVALGLPKKMNRSTRDEKVDRALDLARIGHLQERAVQALSGGEQQRVAIARALAHRPRALLLDEPFHSLDGPLKREVLADLRALVTAERIATIFVTHDTEEAASFAERIVMLRAGKMVRDGSFADLYGEPPDREAAEFLGPIEEVDAVAALASAIEVPAGHDKGPLSFRREHLVIDEATDKADDGARVVDVRAYGAHQDVTLRLQDGTEVVARDASERVWRPGCVVNGRITRLLSWPEAEERT